MADKITTATAVVSTVQPEIHKIAPISGFTNVYGVEINPMVIVLFALLVFCVWFIYAGVKKNNFNVWDLVQDVKADGTRVASVIKSMYTSVFVVATWVIVDQEIKATLTDGLFLAYLGTFAAPVVAKLVWDKPMPMNLPERTHV